MPSNHQRDERSPPLYQMMPMPNTATPTHGAIVPTMLDASPVERPLPSTPTNCAPATMPNPSSTSCMIPEATRDVPATKSPVRSSITPIVSFVPCISITSGAINAGMTRKSLMKWTAVNTPIEAVSAATVSYTHLTLPTSDLV